MDSVFSKLPLISGSFHYAMPTFQNQNNYRWIKSSPSYIFAHLMLIKGAKLVVNESSSPT